MSELSRRIRAGARRKIRRIILAEGEDTRVIEAAKTVVYENIARPILLGDACVIERLADRAGLELDTITVADPRRDRRLDRYAKILCERNDMPHEAARELAKEPMNFGMLMLCAGAADGMVCGCAESSADVTDRALNIIGTAPDCSVVSASFLMNMRDGRMFSFADCAVNASPTAEQVADTAQLSARVFEGLTGEGARVAMLSYSTYGAASEELVIKMRKASLLTAKKYPRLFIGGELQLDAAMDDHVANLRIGSGRARNANVLIFPDLNSAIVSRRLVQRLTRASVIGPIMQGFAAPVNDLPDGCSADEIADMVAVTAVQANDSHRL